jgi:hypothetical protein
VRRERSRLVFPCIPLRPPRFNVPMLVVARQIFSLIFQFSIFHITFVIYHCWSRLWRATVYDKQNIENETTKAPQSVVHLSQCATRHLARPAILSGNDDLLDPEIFPAKRDLHRQAIQRERACDRQRGVYLSWRPRRSFVEGAGAYGSNTKHALPLHRRLA